MHMWPLRRAKASEPPPPPPHRMPSLLMVAAVVSLSLLLLLLLLRKLRLWQRVPGRVKQTATNASSPQTVQSSNGHSGVAVASSDAVQPTVQRANPGLDAKMTAMATSSAAEPSAIETSDDSASSASSASSTTAATGTGTGTGAATGTCTATANAITASLPPSASRRGVTAEELEELRQLMREPVMQSGAHLFDGLLCLGMAREMVLLEPRRRDGERPGYVAAFAQAMAWRRTAEVDRIRTEGVPRALVDADCQPRAHSYGATTAGLPVMVDTGSEWRRAMLNCRNLKLTPTDFGRARIYWHEACLGLVQQAHARGEGNGAFVAVLDLGGMESMGVREALAGYPFIKASIITIALHYSGAMRRVYVARPPRTFFMLWNMLKPFLAPTTLQKVKVLPCRAAQRLEDYPSDDPLCTVQASALPPELGGTADASQGTRLYWEG